MFKSRSMLRGYATHAKQSHDILIVGGGTAGVNMANMIQKTYRDNHAEPPSVSVIDKAQLHHYQPGWTLVGLGLTSKQELNVPMSDAIPKHANHVKSYVKAINPEENSLVTDDGMTHTYKSLILCPGIRLNYDAVEGLRESMGKNGVSTIYDYDQCDGVWANVKNFERGKALFTFPAAPVGNIKCAGAPIKIAFSAEDYWRRIGRRGDISVEYVTSLPKMFGVQKYSDILKDLAGERDIKTTFQTVLTKVDGPNKIAEFTTNSGDKIQKEYDFLHATVPMAPHEFIKSSSISNPAGFVAVDEKTLRSTKYDNVWSLGDASSLPTSKTAAAVMSQAPVLAHNLYRASIDAPLNAEYDGYTSCPLLVGRELILAEFGYGGEIKESFTKYGLDQGRPSKWAYYLKKDVFPAAYLSLFLNGRWFGRNGLVSPSW